MRHAYVHTWLTVRASLQRCPLLLRMFPRNGGHNRVTEFHRGLTPAGELSVHTWMDADLRELAELVQQTQPTARHREAEMEFALVFPDKRGVNVMRIVRFIYLSLGPGPLGPWRVSFCDRDAITALQLVVVPAHVRSDEGFHEDAQDELCLD